MQQGEGYARGSHAYAEGFVMAAAQELGPMLLDPPVRLSHVPETLSPEDAHELRWYLGGDALFMPEGSTFGAQLERAALFATIAPCRRCNETGRAPKRGTYAEALKIWQRAEAKRLKMQVSRSGHGGMLLSLLGIDLRVYTPAEAAEIIGPIPEHLTKKCSTCDGTGVVATQLGGGKALTARPTGSSREPWTNSGASMGDPNLARYGRVSRRLCAVRARDALGCAALELYHQPGGSYGAVWVLTDAGQDLLRDNAQGLHPTQLFANIQAAARDNASHPRAGTIARASFEAGQLVRRGAVVWNAQGRLIERKPEGAPATVGAWCDVVALGPTFRGE